MLSGGGGRTGVRPRACLAQSALHVQAPSTRHCMLTAVSVAAGKAQITSGRRLPSFRRKQRSSMAACLLQLRRMPSGPAPACGKHAGRRLRCAVQALRGGSATTGGLSRRQHTQERILRYPDGRERVLRYSCEATMEEDDEEASFAAWEGSGFYVVPGRRDQAGQQAVAAAQQHGGAAVPSFADTAAYLESLFAASYEMQPEVDVDHTYQVLDGCPWVLPRPVYVLTRGAPSSSSSSGGGGDADIRSTYTLRTKVVQEGAADALAKLLKKQHLAGALEVADMRDGVVMFEADTDADRFAGMLEEEGHSQVLIAEVDSHRMFRSASEVRALVVLLRAGTPLPAPYQLAASLKKKTSWDSL